MTDKEARQSTVAFIRAETKQTQNIMTDKEEQKMLKDIASIKFSCFWIFCVVVSWFIIDVIAPFIKDWK